MKRNVLILTDHKNHTPENSLYELAVKMLNHADVEKVDIATRSNSKNDSFFNCMKEAALYATSIANNFRYSIVDHPLSKDDTKINVSDYDIIWLRLPPPLSEQFLKHINSVFTDALVINNPDGILKTGSKEFLMNFNEVCPQMQICRSISDIIDFKNKFPIVLKPFREYGGRGIVKIVGDDVSIGKTEITFDEFKKQYGQNHIDYLGVKFLKNVRQGDKRIVVVNGEILGASLRLPAKDSWICNAAMGGSSNITHVDQDEKNIIDLINPTLSKLGIVMYGVDTLVGDDGRRVLSEINTTSIGGIKQMATLTRKPLVEKAINLIWSYYDLNA